MNKEIVENFIKENCNEDWSEEHKNIIKFVCYKTSIHPKNVVDTLNNNGGNYNKIIQDFNSNKMIDIVMRQTEYNREKSIEMLKKHKGDVNKVIKEYLGIDLNPVKEESKKSTNQKIFNEIRNFMDKSKINNDIQKENTKNMAIIDELAKQVIDNKSE